MKNKTLRRTLILMAVLLQYVAVNAQQEAKETTTPSGLKVKMVQRGTGVQAKHGDRVSVHYVGTLADGTKFDSSRDRGQPFAFNLGSGQVIKGWDEGIALLHVGDKAILTIPPAIGYGEQAVGTIPANSTLTFEVELLEVKEKITAKPYDVAGKDTVTLEKGLKMIMVKKGTGVKAENGKNVSVHYTGYLMDGSKFDSSVERGDPLSFPLGQGRVIPGWEMGIATLNVGSQARIIIPFELGYGEKGFPPVIPPNATLIFDVELVGVN